MVTEVGAGGGVEVWSKAVDSDHNVQPGSTRKIWNLRSLLNNAYSKTKFGGNLIILKDKILTSPKSS